MNNLLDAISPLIHGSDNNNPNHSNFEPNFLKISSYVDIEELIKSIKNKCSNKNMFNVLSLNCQSVRAKFSELELLLDALASEAITIHALCLQETWLNDDDDISLLQIVNYSFVHKPKSCSAHGGLAFYVHKSLSFEILDSINSNVFENQLLRLSSQCAAKKIVTICNVYRPPTIDSITLSSAIDSFNEQFSGVCSTVHQDCNMSLILGDFNLDCLKVNENDNVATFLDTVFSEGFIPQITVPSRYSVQYGSSSLIDNILLKSFSDTYSFSHVLTSRISDHFVCFTSLDLGTKGNSPAKKIDVPSNDPKNFDTFSSELLNMDIMNQIDSSDSANPSSNYDILASCLSRAHKIAFPTKTVRFNKYKHKQNPWITNGI